MAYFPDITG